MGDVQPSGGKHVILSNLNKHPPDVFSSLCPRSPFLHWSLNPHLLLVFWRTCPPPFTVDNSKSALSWYFQSLKFCCKTPAELDPLCFTSIKVTHL